MDIDTRIPVTSTVLTSEQYAESKLAAKPDDDGLGRDAFLTLFTAQLQNQDPLDPMDNESFVSQLAQFSSLESMQSVDNSMQTMTQGMKSDRFLLGANLLGTNINVPGQYSELMEGSYISGNAKVLGNFESLDFVVSNVDGKIVYERRLENVLPGDLSLMWNGKDLTGEQQPSGKYSLELTATDNGKQIKIPVSTAQTINSVKWNEAKNEVLVEISDGRTFSLQSLEQFNI